MNKVKLLSSLATASVIGAVVPIVHTSCSTNPNLTTNWMIYEGRKYELANNFNPNNLCGEEFVIPLKNGSILPVVSVFKLFITKIVLNVPNIRVTQIKDHFLEGCIGLEEENSLDLSGLSGVTSIGNYFLSGCTGLKSFDFRPLKSLQHVGGGFAYQSRNLVHVNTGYLDVENFDDSEYTFATDDSTSRSYGVGVELEGEYKSNIALKFKPENGENEDVKLYRYTVSEQRNIVTAYLPTPGTVEKSLQRIELEPKAKFADFVPDANKQITLKPRNQHGQTITADCADILNLSLRDMDNTEEEIPNYYLKGCSSLMNVLWSNSENITKIGLHFMYDCLAFNVIDLSPFPNVVTIGDNFLEGTNVMYVNMTTFAHQPEIQTGINFLSRCDNLIYVDMGDIKAENVNVTGSTEDHSFSAYCNLTALSVVLGIIIAGSGCSQYLGRFTNGISGASLEEIWIRNVKIIGLI